MTWHSSTPAGSELDQYDYDVPAHLVAQKPLANRSDARLLVVDRRDGTLSHRHVRDLAELLCPADCLVVNDTRVIPARLVGYRIVTGGRWQGLFLEQDPDGHWRVLCKTRGKMRPGEPVMLVDSQLKDAVRLFLIEKLPGGEWIAHPDTDDTTLEVLERIGRVPLPHYIRGGNMQEADKQSYQTVYASRDGAVAAPTAGLHLTVPLLRTMAERGLTIVPVTLHVGAGTFRPIKTSSLDEHPMHEEWGEIDPKVAEKIDRCRSSGGRAVAVGTTVVRVLETAARDGALEPWCGRTDLFIRPPYAFRAVDALLTNFHWPRSTLLVLVHALGGHDLIRRAYEEAIREQYRLFSYGDAMLIL